MASRNTSSHIHDGQQQQQPSLTGWLYDFVFGQPTSGQPQCINSSHNASSRPAPPTSHLRPPIASDPPPLLADATTPPEAPPRRRHRMTASPAADSSAIITPPPPRIASEPPATRTGVYPRYQDHVNRISAVSTLVEEDIDGEKDMADRPASRMHYGPAPAHIARRYATERIRLTNGNLVINRDIPPSLLKILSRRDYEEFITMRYTAVTCEPDQVPLENYTLRQQIYNRQTEIFIVITMYNEDEVLFARTMHGVMKNIAHLCKQKRSDIWNADGWKKVVVSIVADGRKNINKKVLNMLAAMGVYQSGVAKSEVDNKPVKAHLYEFTTQIVFDEHLNPKGADQSLVPVQILFCLKEKNAKKINSHRWFFNAFGPLLNPEICVLLDVGTRPGNVSIYQLWKTFHIHPNVGGACGEIRAMLGPACRHLANPLVAAQNFEYKMSNILDKPMESVFGYISVLPGAFSAYRYRALKNDHDGHGPLEKYFKGEALHDDGGLFEANMYLAEDRILCFELVAKKNEQWLLQYVNSAFAETDVPDGLPEFISQRRRWLNGSFFAGVYSLWHYRFIWRSRHSFTRLLLLSIEMLYNVISLVFSWFALGNFYIAFYFITKSLAKPEVDPFGGDWGGKLFDVFRYIYLFVVVVVFICSMGNRPQVTKWLFTGCLAVLSLLMVYMLFAASWMVYKGIELAKTSVPWTSDAGSNIVLALQNTGLRNMMVSVLATYGIYFISSLLYRQPMHMITSFLPYLILLPGFTNILNIYAFCNTHDVSWGTKGDNTPSKELGVVKKKKEAGNDDVNAVVEVALPVGSLDADTQYTQALEALRRKEEKEPPPKRNKEDYYRAFRTHLVLAWIGCNALLIVLITSTDYGSMYEDSAGTSYMAFILWANAGLALFRFLGSCIYLILRLFMS